MTSEPTNTASESSRGIDPDLIAGTVIVLGAGVLLTRTSDMPGMTALLPVTMLSALILLGVLLIGRCVLRRRRQTVAPIKVFDDAKRFFGIVASIAIYVAAVALLGFYTATAVMIPVVAWCFGYRSLKGVLLADLIFTGGIAIIFVLLMGQELPTEFFLR
ncbi:tripartite tricarboxylate transporter TctB family protein [Larsenimonas rhizosphaerae]|uniref:Tripartite tricarboxylate transporter TctB family protein n=1 Tax=Larsenimonas rhizosphaerae TaxID=2944682 RepID=A0AA42CWQ6_9GAMM|nr:tripartite tricarboxylate transporter TctB family protein [Larsenimonas rhizosphaerae]MCM2130232.1 tripartite tricarboxylate transporter TctB family protein [Larsenimonas rhizosphaerae]MCX2522935.1 tripartite tricarboxylate transporter TctB family protein [Larsenimonas rhizosphaerae]